MTDKTPLPPGAELDRMVAEKVMGAVEGPFIGLAMSETWDIPDIGIVRRSKWSPSTNITDAWEVVEKMRERGFTFWIDSCGFPGEEWRVQFTHDDPEPTRFYCEDRDTAPHAICLAAIASVDAGTSPKEPT